MKLSELASLEWWVTVGLGTIILSIFSDAIRQALYALLGKLSRSWRQRNLAAKARRAEHAEFAAAHQWFYDDNARSESRSRSVAIYNMLLAILFLSMFSVIQGFVSIDKASAKEWNFPIQESHVLPILSFAIALAFTYRSSFFWGKASYSGAILLAADDIKFQALIAPKDGKLPIPQSPST